MPHQYSHEGPGIAAFAAPRVFERFFSLPRPDGNPQSTGLGLALVHKIATPHRGNIVRDIRGTEKRRLQARELNEEFDAIRKMDLMDESVGMLLREQYV